MIKRKAFRRGIGQPVVDRQAVALGLGDLARLFVEEKLVIEAVRRRAAKRLADLRRQHDTIDQILAGHFVVDTKREPAHRPIGLPLALDPAARDEGFDFLAGFRIEIDDGALLRVTLDHRHLQHGAGSGTNRQEGRIGRLPLVAKRRQDDVHHLIVDFKHPHERFVETAGGVIVGRAGELVSKAETVQKSAKPGIVRRAELNHAPSRRDPARG